MILECLETWLQFEHEFIRALVEVAKDISC